MVKGTGGHPAGLTRINVACHDQEGPTCPQVTVKHTWALSPRGSLSWPEWSCTTARVPCCGLLVTWLKPLVNKVQTLGRGLRRLMSLPPHTREESAGVLGQARAVPQLAWSHPADPLPPPAGSACVSPAVPPVPFRVGVRWPIPDMGLSLLFWNILNLSVTSKAHWGGGGRIRWNLGDKV